MGIAASGLRAFDLTQMLRNGITSRRLEKRMTRPLSTWSLLVKQSSMPTGNILSEQQSDQLHSLVSPFYLDTQNSYPLLVRCRTVSLNECFFIREGIDHCRCSRADMWLLKEKNMSSWSYQTVTESSSIASERPVRKSVWMHIFLVLPEVIDFDLPMSSRGMLLPLQWIMMAHHTLMCKFFSSLFYDVLSFWTELLSISSQFVSLQGRW